MSKQKRHRPAKASFMSRLECLKVWLRSQDMPLEHGSFLKESPNYKYKEESYNN